MELSLFSSAHNRFLAKGWSLDLKNFGVEGHVEGRGRRKGGKRGKKRRGGGAERAGAQKNKMRRRRKVGGRREGSGGSKSRKGVASTVAGTNRLTGRVLRRPPSTNHENQPLR